MAVGKSLLIVTGVGYGIVKALDAISEESASSPEPTPQDPQDATLRRLDGLEERLVRTEKGVEVLTADFERLPSDAVTRAELNAAMEQLSNRLETEIEHRFEAQNRSVQSLRTMVARTDELLEQVIENIESMSLTA